jgi:1-acyl-sn-glycerol-3-phosphate acyltransferase
VALLKLGHVLSVFPQGQITKTEEVADVKHGAVLMALQADVPIIPMYIKPNTKWYQAHDVVIGEPIYPKALCTKRIPSTADIQKISETLAAEMNRCIPQKETVQ